MMESSMTQSQYKKHFIKFPKIELTVSNNRKYFIKFPKIELTVSNSNFCSTFLKGKKKGGPHFTTRNVGYQYFMVKFLKVVPLKKKRRYFCPCI
jgi:hypothetical protein